MLGKLQRKPPVPPEGSGVSSWKWAKGEYSYIHAADEKLFHEAPWNMYFNYVLYRSRRVWKTFCRSLRSVIEGIFCSRVGFVAGSECRSRSEILLLLRMSEPEATRWVQTSQSVIRPERIPSSAMCPALGTSRPLFSSFVVSRLAPKCPLAN